jgi:hypothetical protein
MLHGDCVPKYQLRLDAQRRAAQHFRNPVKEARHLEPIRMSER